MLSVEYFTRYLLEYLFFIFYFFFWIFLLDIFVLILIIVLQICCHRSIHMGTIYLYMLFVVICYRCYYINNTPSCICEQNDCNLSIKEFFFSRIPWDYQFWIVYNMLITDCATTREQRSLRRYISSSF